MTLQVLPFDAGGYPGMGSPFTVLAFGDHDPDVVYLENQASGLYLERRDQAVWFNDVFNHLRAAASAPAQSVAMIQALLE